MSNLSVSAGAITPLSISSMDLETAMAAVQGTRSQLLEGQLKEQLASVQQKNEQMAAINEQMNQMRTQVGQMEAQLPVKENLETAHSHMNELLTKCTKDGQWIGISNVWGGDDAEASKQMEKMLQDLGIDTSGIKDIDSNGTRDASRQMIQQFIADIEAKLEPLKNLSEDIASTKTNIENAKTEIDSLSNSQQMEMLRLQSLSNKRNEAFDLMSNFVKKMQDNRSNILGNMR